METKVCATCGLEKSFNPKNHRINCKECASKIYKERKKIAIERCIKQGKANVLYATQQEEIKPVEEKKIVHPPNEVRVIEWISKDNRLISFVGDKEQYVVYDHVINLTDFVHFPILPGHKVLVGIRKVKYIAYMRKLSNKELEKQNIEIKPNNQMTISAEKLQRIINILMEDENAR